MAILIRQPGPRFAVQVYLPDKRRTTIHLGEISETRAKGILAHVESIAAALKAGVRFDPDLQRWVDSLDDKLHAKLSRVGLLAPRKPAATADATTVAGLVDRYIGIRTDIKPRTVRNYQQARRWLIGFFGADRPLASITAGDAKEWALYMAGKGLAENTARKWIACAKLFFGHAVDKEWISRNPFKGLKSRTVEVRDREFFVTAAMAARVLDASPDHEWRLLFALARYGALRTPSESLLLRWQDVDWQAGVMVVRSPKTERFRDKAERVVPIFAELRPHLEAAWEAAPEGATYVVARYRDTGANLRTQLERIIRRAGLTRWPKPWQNCRASRETELLDAGYPIQCVTKWLGHSEAVAKLHYLQVTPEHVAQAIREGAGGGGTRGAISGAVGRCCTTPQGNAPELGVGREAVPVLDLATQVLTVQGLRIPLRGVEPRFSD